MKIVFKHINPKLGLAVAAFFVIALVTVGLLCNQMVRKPQPEQSPPQNAPQTSSTPEMPSAAVLTENGLTADENAELKLQKKMYEAATPEQQIVLLGNATVGCKHFEHLWWEECLSIELVTYAEKKAERSFDAWVDASVEREQCVSIYDLARDFYIPYFEMAEAIKAAGQEELYPLEQLKARFAYFGLPVTKEEVSYIEQIGILQSAGMVSYNWSSPEAINPENFMLYYQLTEPWTPPTTDVLPNNLEDGAYSVPDSKGVKTIYIGENTMYKAISKHFAITENQLHTVENYNPDLRAYVFTDWGFGAPTDSGITAIEKGSGNEVTISYESYSRAGDGTVVQTGRLKMRENADGVYEYLSSENHTIE